MRIVIDTNVLLSGLLWHGTPHALFDQVRAGMVELVMSPALMDEIERAIRYPKFAAILARTTRTPERILTELQALAEMVTAAPLPQPVCRDPDDDAVLACALAAHANWIVSGDDDLLALKAFQSIPIVTAALALQRIEAQR
ncbi:MAG: putative toxin-antitoxin system toxin component, PIN family [Betaproteobacteria bacterium]|nr:putative toxin-antitoxin system toxin component, PIN family [Betaproteobacteria bacterium]